MLSLLCCVVIVVYVINFQSERMDEVVQWGDGVSLHLHGFLGLMRGTNDHAQIRLSAHNINRVVALVLRTAL